MSVTFRSFVIFAEMRTGSNFLEANLNALDGVSCHGEAFNPHFIGYPKKASLLGVSQKKRDRNPQVLLEAVHHCEGIAGFRYFHDHDPRVLDRILDDPHCAKIILTRDPMESYVSWKIARTTGQWKLTDASRRKDARADFDPEEFEEYMAALAAFRQQVTRHLQLSGQTAFALDYNDLQSVDVINGLARFLGATARLPKLDGALKVQNPASIASKVSNAGDMDRALQARSAPDLDRLPDFEPQRYAAVPTYVLGAWAPLVFMPVRCGAHDRVVTWLASLDDVTISDLPTRMTQKALRMWKRAHPGHRSFTVVSHPVVRAHRAYCRHILGSGPQVYAAIRQTLVRRYDLPLPETGPDESYSLDAHRAGFAVFLRFLKENLSGQTALRVDSAWCTQAHMLQGFAGFAAPDRIIREPELEMALPQIAQSVGYDACQVETEAAPDTPFDLGAVYDEEIEALAAAAYQRDYMVSGSAPGAERSGGLF